MWLMWAYVVVKHPSGVHHKLPVLSNKLTVLSNKLPVLSNTPPALSNKQFSLNIVNVFYRRSAAHRSRQQIIPRES